jgi:hypothetical protein
VAGGVGALQWCCALTVKIYIFDVACVAGIGGGVDDVVEAVAVDVVVVDVTGGVEVVLVSLLWWLLMRWLLVLLCFCVGCNSDVGVVVSATVSRDGAVVWSVAWPAATATVAAAGVTSATAAAAAAATAAKT